MLAFGLLGVLGFIPPGQPFHTLYWLILVNKVIAYLEMFWELLNSMCSYGYMTTFR